MDFPELGPGWYDPFVASPYSLRFELGGEAFDNTTQSVPRFIQAFDRARAVADHIFPITTPLLAVVGSWPLKEKELFFRRYKPQTTGIHLLKQSGFEGTKVLREWAAPFQWADPDDDAFQVDWQAFDISDTRHMRDVLIWNAVAQEMLVEPKAPVVCCLYNPTNEITLYIYDDRGMDVKALTPEPLLDVYRDFDKWLLDYDRLRMAAAFGTPIRI